MNSFLDPNLIEKIGGHEAMKTSDSHALRKNDLQENSGQTCVALFLALIMHYSILFTSHALFLFTILCRHVGLKSQS